MQAIIMRYHDTPKRATEMGSRRNGALKTLALGAIIRIQNGEVIPADEFKEICGSQRYSDLVTRVEKDTCILVEVEHKSTLVQA